MATKGAPNQSLLQKKVEALKTSSNFVDLKLLGNACVTDTGKLTGLTTRCSVSVTVGEVLKYLPRELIAGTVVVEVDERFSGHQFIANLLEGNVEEMNSLLGVHHWMVQECMSYDVLTREERKYMILVCYWSALVDRNFADTSYFRISLRDLLKKADQTGWTIDNVAKQFAKVLANNGSKSVNNVVFAMLHNNVVERNNELHISVGCYVTNTSEVSFPYYPVFQGAKIGWVMVQNKPKLSSDGETIVAYTPAGSILANTVKPSPAYARGPWTIDHAQLRAAYLPDKKNGRLAYRGTHIYQNFGRRAGFTSLAFTRSKDPHQLMALETVASNMALQFVRVQQYDQHLWYHFTDLPLLALDTLLLVDPNMKSISLFPGRVLLPVEHPWLVHYSTEMARKGLIVEIIENPAPMLKGMYYSLDPMELLAHIEKVKNILVKND